MLIATIIVMAIIIVFLVGLVVLMAREKSTAYVDLAPGDCIKILALPMPGDFIHEAPMRDLRDKAYEILHLNADAAIEGTNDLVDE